MIQKCYNCGNEDDDSRMVTFNPGTGTQWWCWKCYKLSQYEATKSDMFRHQGLYKINQSKQRDK